MAKKVYVTAAHRKAAQSLVASGARTGKDVSPAVVKIANAKVESSSPRRAAVTPLPAAR